MRDLCRISAAVVVMLAVDSAAAFAASCGRALNKPGYPVKNHTCLDLINESPGVFSQTDLEYAKGKWSSCHGTGTKIPSIHVGNSYCKDVKIRHVPGKNPRSGGPCESVTTTFVGNILLEAQITIYTMQNNGTSCLPLREDIGHAIGHILAGRGESRAPARARAFSPDQGGNPLVNRDSSRISNAELAKMTRS